MKSAPEIEGEAPPGPEHIGPAHAELHSMATDAVRAKPGLSSQRAVANIFESKPGLRARVQREHLAHALANAGRQQGNGTMKIDFSKMAPSYTAIEFKKHYETGAFAEISKADWHALIEDGAEQHRGANETREQAYARLVTADPLGRELFRVYRNCESQALYNWHSPDNLECAKRVS